MEQSMVVHPPSSKFHLRSSHAPDEPPRSHRDRTTILFAIAAFAACSLAAAIRSTGFLESDGGTHYMLSRFALREPYHLVDVWGRPFCTALFALPATFGGLLGVRVTSLLLAITCALIAYRIAIGQEYRWPVLALIFCFAQPLLFLHSFSELTELPFATLIVLAFWAYQQQRWALMAAIAALGPAARPEGFGFLLLAAAALVLHRRFVWLILLPLPLILWSYAGWALTGHQGAWWLWLPHNWPYAESSTYPSGSIFHFVMLLPMVVGPFALPAMWIGMWRSFAEGSPFQDHRRRCQWLIALLPLAVLGVHSLLYRFGKMASNGEERYLLVVSPMWALLAAKGWEWAFVQFNWRNPIGWAALAAVWPGSVNYVWRVLPLQQPTSWIEAQRLVDWYEHSPIRARYPRIMTNHPGVNYFLDVSPTDSRYVVGWSKWNIAHPRPGTILFWDPEFSVHNSDQNLVVPLQEVIAAGWVNDWPAEWKSNVNNPPPWANYKVLERVAEPKDKSLANTPMLWHIFESPTGNDGSKTNAPPLMPDANKP